MEQLTEMRQALLEEMVNISFGKAAAALAELLNVFVILNPPKVEEVACSRVTAVLEERIGSDQELIIVQQGFHGELSGEVALLVAAETGRAAIKILQEGGGFLPDVPKEDLETEMILEIGNIVIGACMNHLSELLKKTVRYEAPHILWEVTATSDLSSGQNKEEQNVLMVFTKFHLGDNAFTGNLAIILNRQWFEVLYTALDNFWEQLSSSDNDRLPSVS